MTPDESRDGPVPKGEQGLVLPPADSSVQPCLIGHVATRSGVKVKRLCSGEHFFDGSRLVASHEGGVGRHRPFFMSVHAPDQTGRSIPVSEREPICDRWFNSTIDITCCRINARITTVHLICSEAALAT